MWASLIPGAISVLGGLFGGHAPKNPYMSQISNALGAAGTQANNLNNLGNQASNTYSQFSPQANAAVENYARYLQQNPYTSAYSTALLNRATNGTTAAYQQAKSQLQADLAARGMSGSGMEAGALGTIDASQAQAMANAQNNLALQQIGQLGQNQATLVDLFSGAANNAYGQAGSDYSGAAGIYDNIAQQYGGLGAQQQQLDYDQQQANQKLIDDGLMGIGSGLGDYFDTHTSSGSGNNTAPVSAQENSTKLQQAQQQFAQSQNNQNPASYNLRQYLSTLFPWMSY